MYGVEDSFYVLHPNTRAYTRTESDEAGLCAGGKIYGINITPNLKQYL